ncbi:SPOR domain-containing protein, partial [Antarcticimicrobium luteum]
MSTLSAQAQSLRNATAPAEFPPASFAGKQYVDSRGCIFIRAGIDGNVTWVPRVGRDRKQVCGYKPTAVAGATAGPAAPRGPAPVEITVPAAAQPAAGT